MKPSSPLREAGLGEILKTRRHCLLAFSFDLHILISMSFDFFTTSALAAELRNYLRGKKIIVAGSDAQGVGLACERSGYFYARVGPDGYICYLPGPFPARLSGKKGPECYLRNALVDDIWAAKRDRIIKVRLVRKNRSRGATYGQLICELIPSRVQIVLISEHSSAVLGKWAREKERRRKMRVAVGQPYIPLSPQDRLLPGEDPFSSFSSRLQPKDKVGSVLESILVGIDKDILPEILHRLGLNPDVSVAELDGLQRTRIWSMIRELYSSMPQTGGYVWQEGRRYFFSALEPTYKGKERIEFLSISEALILAIEKDRVLQGEGRKKQRLERGLSVTLKRLGKRIGALRRDLDQARRAEELEKMGSILMAQLPLVKPGLAQVELPDIYDPSGRSRVVIKLDRRRTPAENGKWFLKTSKKLQRRRQVLPRRLQQLESEAEAAERFLLELKGSKEVDSGEIEKWLREHGVGMRGEQKQSRRGFHAHPRRYCTASGWSVWAGRNNKENDDLTHRVAAKNDIWLHAHGYAGSHVILRRKGRLEEPSAQTIKEAAAVAAYWSKGRTARKVAVVYTLVKYVLKPRGSDPGTAAIRRGQTLLVEPALLPGEDGTRSV